MKNWEWLIFHCLMEHRKLEEWGHHSQRQTLLRMITLPAIKKQFVHVDFRSLRQNKTPRIFASLHLPSTHGDNSPLISFHSCFFRPHARSNTWRGRLHNTIAQAYIVHHHIWHFPRLGSIRWKHLKQIKCDYPLNSAFPKKRGLNEVKSPRSGPLLLTIDFTLQSCPEKTGQNPITCSFKAKPQKIDFEKKSRFWKVKNKTRQEKR